MAFLSRLRSHPAARHTASGSQAKPFAPPRHVASPEGCYFYHTTDLPEFGVKEGGWDLRGRFLDYIGHVDVGDKRVLDVGCASGFLSFEAERHGAREVVSFDLDHAGRQDLLPFAGSPFVDDHARWVETQTAVFATWQRAYWLTHRLLRSRARVFYGDVYDLPDSLGLFDVVIVGAVLEHLIDPLGALYALSRRVGDMMVINTDYFDTPGPVALFKGRADQPDHSFTFWTYSIALYDEYMKIMGFEPVTQRKDTFAGTPSVPGGERPMMDRVALCYRRIRADTRA